MNKAERRAYQDGLEADRDSAANARARQEQPRTVPREQQCPAKLGRTHNFTMKGSDGKFRCWYCVRTRAEVQERQP